jgi:RES domain-containing protein
LALAALEYLGTLVDLNDTPADLVALVAELDENAIEAVDAASLPGWDATPPDASVRFGSDWARERRSVALRVPSVMIPSEQNYVLNPEHSDFHRAVVVGQAQRFTFDQRLIRLMKS